MTTVPGESKWKWIARICREKGFTGAEELAKEIDEVLIDLYGRWHTPNWVRSYERHYSGLAKVDVEDLLDVANSRGYCIACMLHSFAGGCSTCRFAKASGFCWDDLSLFGRFMEELKNAEEKEEEE